MRSDPIDAGRPVFETFVAAYAYHATNINLERPALSKAVADTWGKVIADTANARATMRVIRRVLTPLAPLAVALANQTDDDWTDDDTVVVGTPGAGFALTAEDLRELQYALERIDAALGNTDAPTP